MGALHSSRCDYALRALLELAKRHGAGPVRIVDVAEAQSVPVRFLEAILADLRRAGVVESRRGVKGGYWMGRPPESLTVAEVIRAVDGDFVGVPSEEGTRTNGRAPGSLAFRGMWKQAARALAGVYEQTTFQALVEEDRRRCAQTGPDFAI